MNYQESRAYIDQISGLGRVLGLENIEGIDKKTGKSSRTFKIYSCSWNERKRFHAGLYIHGTERSRIQGGKVYLPGYIFLSGNYVG